MSFSIWASVYEFLIVLTISMVFLGGATGEYVNKLNFLDNLVAEIGTQGNVTDAFRKSDRNRPVAFTLQREA